MSVEESETIVREYKQFYNWVNRSISVIKVYEIVYIVGWTNTHVISIIFEMFVPIIKLQRLSS